MPRQLTGLHSHLSLVHQLQQGCKAARDLPARALASNFFKTHRLRAGLHSPGVADRHLLPVHGLEVMMPAAA